MPGIVLPERPDEWDVAKDWLIKQDELEAERGEKQLAEFDELVLRVNAARMVS